MIAARKGVRDSGGFALIVVLWFLVLIAAIGSFLIAHARSEAAIARNIRLAASAEALADAGVAAAVFNQTDPVPLNRWKLDGTPHAVALLNGEATIRLFDENEKINPNRASDALLTALFQSAGIERSVSRRLGGAIADWVGAETEPRPEGAKKAQYTAAGRSYGPPNAPMESLDELQLVLGMTPEIFALVRPYVSIFAESEEPDPRNAPLLIRRALILAQREADVAEASENAEFDPDAPPPPQSTEKANPKTDHNVISLDVAARVQGGGVFVRSAVVRLDSANPKGYVVLDWRRGDLGE